MKYKVGDLVYFEDYDQKGVGKVVVMDNSPKKYLVHSTDIVGGHDNGESMEAKQDNDNNWWFVEGELKPFTDTDDPLSEVEFYEDTPSVEENEMFTLEDLKPGYLVKVKDGRFAHIVDTTMGGLCLNYVESWSRMSYYYNDLTYKGSCVSDIIEVYGLTAYGYNTHKFEVGDRKLLWKRGEGIKESTIKALGAIDKAIEEQTNISGELGIKVEHLGESDKQYILEEGFNFMEDVDGGFIIYKRFDDYDYEEEF